MWQVRGKGLSAAAALLALGLAWPQPAWTQNVNLQAFRGLSFDAAVTALRTETEEAAAGFVLDLFKRPDELPELFLTNCTEHEIRTKTCNRDRNYAWVFYAAPDVKVNTGTGDAFDSIVANMSGTFLVGRLHDPGPDYSDVRTLDPLRPLHLFPFAAGVETTRDASTLNVVAEAGYVPYLLGGGWEFAQNRFAIGLNPRVGIFLQGGQKLREDEAIPGGGRADDSAEAQGEAIGRVKSVVEMEIFLPVPVLGFGTGIEIEPSAIGWYDMLNDEIYYSLKLAINIVIVGDGRSKSTLWQFAVQEGSGAPLFTEGTQFSTGLKLVY